MKKFVSMAMVAAMTTSMVPATAFAAGEATASAKIVDALDLTKDDATAAPYITDNASGVPGYTDDTKWNNKVPELQLKIENTDYRNTLPENAKAEVTLELDNAEWIKKDGTRPVTAADLEGLVSIVYENRGAVAQVFKANSGSGTVLYKESTGDIVTFANNNAIAAGTASIKWLMETAGQTPAVTLTGIATDIWVDADGDGTTEAQIITSDGTDGSWTATSYGAKELALDLAKGTAKFYDAASAGTDVTATVEGKVQFTDNVTTSAVNDSIAGSSFDTFAVADADYEYWVENVAGGYVKGDFVAADGTPSAVGTIGITVKEFDEDSVTYVFTGKFAEDDIIVFDLDSVLDKTGVKSMATVSVSGDLVEADDLVYASVLGRGITATTKKIANVAEEEKVALEKDLKIESTVGEFAAGQVIELKLSNGFEFAKATSSKPAYSFQNRDENYVELVVNAATDEIIIDAADIEVEAVSANSGDVATLKVKATNNVTGGFNASTAVEVAKVVDYTVLMSVDADEDVPVIYSGVNVANYGITDDSDHMSLEVTIEESFPGAWSMRKGFNLELPDGVYVTNVEVEEVSNFFFEDTTVSPTVTKNADIDEWEEAFWNAYKDGDHKNFEFGKRVFNDVDSSLYTDCAEVTFQLEMVADPGFVGDVNLKLTGDLVDEQEVTIATFATPFYVEAEQNDLKIDYRYTDIPTEIKVTEAEAGLWDKGNAMIGFYIEGNHLQFEDDPTFTVSEGSDMELKDDEIITLPIDGTQTDIMAFTVDKESDEAATITISDMQLFMQRNIPAGPYDLKVATSMGREYERQMLYAPDALTECEIYDDLSSAPTLDATNFGLTAWATGNTATRPVDGFGNAYVEDTFVGDVCDFSTTVKEAFVNVVTAGREQDDASFTTKVVVPVGESYIVAGENQVDLDVPAYVSAAGYTMLPVRAVATALGINNNNVIWNGESKTVTILYGQRIITMVAGQKVVNVNGSAIPASAAVEITDGRTFLPMRDLATALGVTDITWDAATKTATLNGGVVAE